MRSDLDARPHRPLAIVGIAVVLGIEAVAMAGLTVLLIVETLTARAASVPSSIALTVCAAIAAAGLAWIAIAALRGAKWFRPAALTWQIVQFFTGVYAFQGNEPRPDLGTLICVPALVGIVLLFTPQVIAATRRR